MLLGVMRKGARLEDLVGGERLFSQTLLPKVLKLLLQGSLLACWGIGAKMGASTLGRWEMGHTLYAAREICLLETRYRIGQRRQRATPTRSCTPVLEDPSKKKQ